MAPRRTGLITALRDTKSPARRLPDEGATRRAASLVSLYRVGYIAASERGSRPFGRGEVAERLKAPHSKCGIRVTVSWVRIPPSPPTPRPLTSAVIQKPNIYGLIPHRSVYPGPPPSVTIPWFGMGRTMERRDGTDNKATVGGSNFSSKERGMYADGGGLYLQVGATGTKSWVFRFAARGKTRDMGLGPLKTIGLAEAREIAAQCRQSRLRGSDPIEDRKARRAAARLDAAKTMTFDQCRDSLSPHIKSAGATTNTGNNGRRRLRPTLLPRSDHYPFKRLTLD